MFSKIRNRLTLFYTTMMFLFLLTFWGISSASLAWILFNQQKEVILRFAEGEAHEHVPTLLRAQPDSIPEVHRSEEGGGALFSYVVDRNDRQIYAEEPSAALIPSVLNRINHWDLPYQAVSFETITAPGGQSFHFLIASAPVTDDSRLLGTVYAGMDITHYYEVLKTLFTVMTVLCLIFLLAASGFGHLLAARAMTAISLLFERQREFIADASHELRTPLSVLLASVETVQDNEKNALSPFSQQVLADMKDEVLRMTKIVGGLLTLARGDSGVAKLAKEIFDISALAEQITRTLDPLAKKKQLALTVNSPEQLPLYADRERIEQLLIILLDNAIKNTQAGSVALTIVESGRQVKIAVKDTGIGISQSEQERIFERFYRVDKARSRETGGTGLGLSIAKWIVEAHKGTIKIESTLGVGSTFIVLLPEGKGGKGQ